jgi:beta-lactamase superfamily II metal-dependent hydrolase
MSLVKSLCVGDGDMFYIRHGNDNFTIIDCCMPDEAREDIVAELKAQSVDKHAVRFISTHPDDDHIRGLEYLNRSMTLLNFYCVRNEATKADWTADFEQYTTLRDDPQRAFYLSKGCGRRWMNQQSKERGSAGINILWPVVSDERYVRALDGAREGGSANNISPIVKYTLSGGAGILWMGDLEADFMEEIADRVTMDPVDILFAPHHGRSSGRVPQAWLEQMGPKLVVIGEAPSEYLDYYEGYQTITQNSAADIVFVCERGETHAYVSDHSYSVDFLDDLGMPDTYGRYIGTLSTPGR